MKQSAVLWKSVLVMRQCYVSKRRKINQAKPSVQLRIKVYIVYKSRSDYTERNLPSVFLSHSLRT